VPKPVCLGGGSRSKGGDHANIQHTSHITGSREPFQKSHLVVLAQGECLREGWRGTSGSEWPGASGLQQDASKSTVVYH
jgi:hypothetical protein